MAKQPKTKEEPRRVGPKFARAAVIPQSFQIRRPSSPMADLLDSAQDGQSEPGADFKPNKVTPVKSTPVKNTPVDFTGVADRPFTPPGKEIKTLPVLEDFVDRILPKFPPARQAILLRLYRWAEGTEKDFVVSTPKLAAITNMDEKSCRAHLHGLIADGFLMRTNDGELIARFGGSDRTSRGLILKISLQAVNELLI